jgi:hypothetical protein
MKKLICVFMLGLAFSVTAYGQDEAVKVIVLNEVLEIVPEEREDSANFQVVNIKRNGKVIKKFSVGAAIFPQVVGTFHGFDSEFVLYRTDMGAGACAGGSLYIIKLSTKYDNNSMKESITDISVSPVLTTCLGEFPFYSLSYTNKGVFMLAVAGHSMNLDLLDKWVENKKPVIKKKK